MSDEGYSVKTIVVSVFIVIAVLLGIAWIVQDNDWFMHKVYDRKYEQVRRETFEESRAYNIGMIQELENMRFDYLKEKDPKARDALGSIILHRAAGYNLNDPDVSEDLRQFISKLKNEGPAEKY